MKPIDVLVAEPDVSHCTWLLEGLSRQGDFRVSAALPGFPFVPIPRLSSQHDVLVLNADLTCNSSVRAWAAVRVYLPGIRIVALTNGSQAPVLECILAAGIIGLQPAGCDLGIVVRAIRHAANGILDFDQALISRAKQLLLDPVSASQIRLGGLTIDFQTHQVTRWGKLIHLTPLEFGVLAYLAHSTGRPVCLDELLECVWSTSLSHGGTLAQVHNCIKRLRRKIEPDMKHPRYLLSERGWGYYLRDPAYLAAAHRPSLLPPDEDDLLTD